MSTPLQIVKEQHGSKSDLIDKIVGLVEPMPEESEDDHKRRLRNVSNAKLLHLLGVGERVKELGGRDAMVKKVLELKSQAKDHEYSDRLKKVPLGQLADMIRSLERAAKRGKPKRRRKKN